MSAPVVVIYGKSVLHAKWFNTFIKNRIPQVLTSYRSYELVTLHTFSRVGSPDWPPHTPQPGEADKGFTHEWTRRSIKTATRGFRRNVRLISKRQTTRCHSLRLLSRVCLRSSVATLVDSGWNCVIQLDLVPVCLEIAASKAMVQLDGCYQVEEGLFYLPGLLWRLGRCLAVIIMGDNCYRRRG